jgi:hypothetical protein
MTVNQEAPDACLNTGQVCAQPSCMAHRHEALESSQPSKHHCRHHPVIEHGCIATLPCCLFACTHQPAHHLCVSSCVLTSSTPLYQHLAVQTAHSSAMPQHSDCLHTSVLQRLGVFLDSKVTLCTPFTFPISSFLDQSADWALCVSPNSGSIIGRCANAALSCVWAECALLGRISAAQPALGPS